MIDPIQKPEAPTQWHYPICDLNDYTSVLDQCPNRMAEQIQRLYMEYSILAKQNRRLEAEVHRLEQIATQ